MSKPLYLWTQQDRSRTPSTRIWSSRLRNITRSARPRPALPHHGGPCRIDVINSFAPAESFIMRGLFHFLSALCLLATAKPAGAQSLDSMRLQVFSPSDLAPDASQNVAFSQQYTPSGSTWLLDFDESSVFQAEMNIAAPGSEFNSYQIRIGKGGNLYSLRGRLPKSVPPQFRPDPWVSGNLWWRSILRTVG